jgi:hypothetical protein
MESADTSGRLVMLIMQAAAIATVLVLCVLVYNSLTSEN